MILSNVNRLIEFLNKHPFFKFSAIVIALAIEFLIAVKLGESIGRFIYYLQH